MSHRPALYHLYGYLPGRDPEELLFPGVDPDPAPARAAGRVYEVLACQARDGEGPWRFVDSLRAISPASAYHLARERNPELAGLALRVEGAGGFHEGAGR